MYVHIVCYFSLLVLPPLFFFFIKFHLSRPLKTLQIKQFVKENYSQVELLTTRIHIKMLTRDEKSKRC